MNRQADLLEGLRRGDTNGGPSTLAGFVDDSLTAKSGLDIGDLSGRYLAWWRGDAFDTGPTFDMVFDRVDKGMKLEEAVLEVDELLKGKTAGCGPAQRSAPLAACLFIPTGQLADAARKEARITHHHPHAGDAAAIVVLLCRHLLEGRSWERAKELVEMHPRTKEAYEAVMSQPLTPGGYALDAVRAALHFMDGEDALVNSKEFAGRENYCPVIVGALLGASS